MGKTPQTIESQLRAAIEADTRALYRLAVDSGVPQSTLYEWLHDQGGALPIRHVSSLCRELGLELRAVK